MHCQESVFEMMFSVRALCTSYSRRRCLSLQYIVTRNSGVSMEVLLQDCSRLPHLRLKQSLERGGPFHQKMRHVEAEAQKRGVFKMGIMIGLERMHDFSFWEHLICLIVQSGSGRIVALDHWWRSLTSIDVFKVCIKTQRQSGQVEIKSQF